MTEHTQAPGPTVVDIELEARALESLADLLSEGAELARRAWEDSASMSIIDDRTLMMRMG